MISTAGNSDPAQPVSAKLRVVLVGRTGLDASLRNESSVELLRARGAIEAIGELGTPLDAESPVDAAVIIAPRFITQDELLMLAPALRRVEPRTAIFGLLDSPADRAVAPDPASVGLDGWVSPPVSAGALRLLVKNRVLAGADERARRGAAPAPIQASAAATSQPAAPEPPVVITRPVGAPVSRSGPDPLPPDAGPEAPVSALLAGADVVTACLSVLRARIGAEDLAYIPGDAPAPAGQRVAAPVTHRQHRFGTLLAPQSAAQHLPGAARWLGAWLALAEQHAQLRRAAFTDPLTGAWNRRYFDGFLARTVAHAREHRRCLTVLLFDIDDFKQYNDDHGHAAGDEILIETVRLLRTVVRPSDRVCRLGGDELAVVFHDPDAPREPGSHHPASVLQATERFRRQLATAQFSKLGAEARGRLTVSAGIATFPWDAQGPQDLVAHADRRLLESKRAGKNALSFGSAGGPTATPSGEGPMPLTT